MGPEPFGFHMTQVGYGLIFTGYSHASPINNANIVSLLIIAVRRAIGILERDPRLVIQPMSEPFVLYNARHELFLSIVPNIPEMTYGNLEDIMVVLARWVEEYSSVECEFEIWENWSQQTKLGKGRLALTSRW